MWYKLSGKTNMAIWITLAGLAVTAVVNVVFMPRFSYWASAFGHLASYTVMFILSASLGAKYYPIPYKWGRLGLFFLLMGAALAGMYLIPAGGEGVHWVNIGLNTVLILAYAGLSWMILRRRKA